MKILLTGATGFVGKSLSLRLLAEKYNIVAPVRSLDSLPKHDLLQPVFITGLQDSIAWPAILDGVEVIVHLASRVHVMKDTSMDPLEEFRKINVDATLNLARQATKAGVKRFVHISSIKVNGEYSIPNKPFTADDKPAPVDPYGVSKYEAEIELLKLSSKTRMEIVIIRPPLVYGPGVKANFQKMIRTLKKGVPLPFGAIQNKRSLVSLDNLIDFTIRCTHHPGAANQIFLVSDGKDLSTTELLKKLSHFIGSSTYLIPVPAYLLKLGLNLAGKQGLSLRLCGWLQVDINKNRDLLDWIPPYDVDVSMQKTTEYYLNNK